MFTSRVRALVALLVYASSVIASPDVSIIFQNATDLVLGKDLSAYNGLLGSVSEHPDAMRFWTLLGHGHYEEDRRLIKTLRSQSKVTARVLVFMDSLAHARATAFFSLLDEMADVLRHVRWLLLTTSPWGVRRTLEWAEDFPRLSCNAAFATWPSLAPCNVPSDPYGAQCEDRHRLLAADECASEIRRWPPPQRSLWNASVSRIPRSTTTMKCNLCVPTVAQRGEAFPIAVFQKLYHDALRVHRIPHIRYDCALGGAEERCEMPTAQALLEAMRFFGVRMRRVSPGRTTNVGVPDAKGLFSGTLGKLQRRQFDLHLSDVALELERFRALFFMEAAYVTSLEFTYAVPAPAAAPGLEELAAVLPLRLWLKAVVAALAVAAAVVLLRPAAGDADCQERRNVLRRKVAKSLSLAASLVALCFGQPLDWRDDLVATAHQRTLQSPPKGGRRHLRWPIPRKTRPARLRPDHSKRDGLCAVRLLLAMWLLSAVAMLTGIRSQLISQLRAPPAPQSLDTTERLRAALEGGTVRPCLINKTGSAEYVLQHAGCLDTETRGVLDVLRRVARQNHTDSVAQNQFACLAKVERGSHVYIDYRAALKLLGWQRGAPFRDRIDASRDSLVTFFGAPVASVGWPHTDNMRRLTSRVFEAGHTLWHERLTDARNVSASQRLRRLRRLSRDTEAASDGAESSSVAAFTLLRFSLAFGALLAGCAASTAVAFCERCCRHRLHRSRL